MGIQTVPVITPASGFNRGQVFTTSGNWTVPAGVTFVQVTLRGGNGSAAAFTGLVGSSSTTNNGTAGGNSVAFSITAPGGIAGSSFSQGQSSMMQQFTYWGHNSHTLAPGDGVEITAIVAVTPGSNQAITVGSGTGSYVSIMWSQ